jgi:methylmalonyl-CoA/ethylmalonyl-CoA epimerase
MKPTKIEPLAVAVKSIDEARKFFENVLGLECYAVEEVADQKVKTAFFKIGEVKIELLEATSPDSTVAGFIEKKGEGLHHIAFAVDNTTQALQDAEAKGVRLIDKAERNGAEGMKIGFLHPKDTIGVLTEFCSK